MNHSQDTLSGAHRAYLRDQAITDAVMDAAGVRSVAHHTDLPGCLQSHSNQHSMVARGIIFPWYPAAGGEPLWELRPDQPPEGCPKYKYPGQPYEVVINVYPFMRDRVADPSVPLLYVEGNKQQLAAVSAIGDRPYAVAGLHGCWGWSRDKMPSPELGLIPHDGRDVVLCLDGDRSANLTVYDAAEGLAAAVRALGAKTVRYLSLPVRGANGIDDYLATISDGDRTAVLTRLIRQATDRPGRRPPPKKGQKVAAVADENSCRYPETLPDLGGSGSSGGSGPPGPPVNGAALLDETVAAIARFVVFPDPAYAAAAALYVAATHAVSQLQFAPRLRVKSPVKRCGKTLLLDVLSCLVHKPLPTANVSTAALVRSIGRDPSTLVLDEMDAVFGRNAKGDEKAETLRGVLNAGFGRDKPYIRYDVNTGQVESFPTFALAIIAGIGDLPDTIEDRAVIVPLARKTAGATVARFRIRRDVPALHDLGSRLDAWIRPLATAIGEAEPPMPPGLSDRAEDTWEPLIAVADAAGGHWPALAREVARMMAAESARADADADVRTRLLADMRTVLGDADTMPTAVILARLAAVEGAPWAAWSHGRALNARQLADLLRPFGPRPHDVKTADGKVTKHYARSDFRDAWSRYDPTPDYVTPAPPTSQQPPVPYGTPPYPPAGPTEPYPVCGTAPGYAATAATAATAQVNGHFPVAAQSAVPLPPLPPRSAGSAPPGPPMSARNQALLDELLAQSDGTGHG